MKTSSKYTAREITIVDLLKTDRSFDSCIESGMGYFVWNVKNNSRGYSIAEVVIAMGVSLIVLGGVVTTLSIVNRGGSQYNLLQARNEIINKIRVQSMNPANLIASAKVTESLGMAGLPDDYGPVSTLQRPELLKKCIPDITGTETYGCNKTEMEETGRGFKFYLAENGSLEPSRVVAGEDVYYKNTGIRCTAAEAASTGSCPLMAKVWFEPFCLNFAQSCTKAMSLAIRYSIGLREDIVDSDLVIPTVDGEFYIPLQRGIQIRNLLNQLDAAITPNTKGIFTIPKFYGHPGQAISGLRFETLISNPYGLVSMRVQSRSLTGPNAKNFDDMTVPSELLAKEWSDVMTPGNSGLGPWAINLNGAIPNQVFNFGTQVTVAANSRLASPYQAAAFQIGSNAVPLDPNYRWTINSTNTEYIAPGFKSGFYQFRVVATDVMGKEVESTNYITVRLVGIPEHQYLPTSNFSPERNCVDTNKSFSVFVGDDEEITFSQIKIQDQIQPTNSVVGTDDLLSFNFLTNQPRGSYPVTLTLKNRFSDVQMETLLVPKVVATHQIVLSDKTPSTDGILSNPVKIRKDESGQVSLNFKSGNCCNAEPSVTWSYLTSPYFNNLPLLSGPTTSQMECKVDGNSRQCSTTITVQGIKEGPNMSSPPNDISGTMTFGSSSAETACQMPNFPASNTTAKYLPVIRVPNVYFYLSESLWLTIPGGTIKDINPSARIRIDFDPSEKIVVQAVSASDPTFEICQVEFDAGTSITPRDRNCPIPSGFSGEIILQRVSSNLQLPGEPDGPTYKAKIVSNYTHRTCQANLTSAQDLPAEYTVPATLPMYDSPYGFTLVNGVKVQDSKNDTGLWTYGRKKKLRCFDTWNGFNQSDNKQDFNDVYWYNYEYLVGKQNLPAKNKSLGIEGSAIEFAQFMVPNNPPLMIDTTSANIPYLYTVLQNGNPGGMAWGVYDSVTKATGTSSPMPWEDITTQLCANNASLSKIRILRNRLSIESSSGTIIMKAANSFVSKNFSGYYSYAFMCSYSRWHPSGKSSATWTD